MKCVDCHKACYQQKVLSEYDAARAIGLQGKLLVRDFPARVCPRCAGIMNDGQVLERIVGAVLADMLRRSRLSPTDARYLRHAAERTQQQLADDLGVVRATVNRWETGAVKLDGSSSLLVRMHVFLRVYQKEPRIRDLLEDLFQFFAGKETPETRKAASVVDGRLVA